MPKFAKVDSVEKKPELAKTDQTIRQPKHGEPMFDHYEIDREKGEMVGYNSRDESGPIPEPIRCQCGAIWDREAFKNNLCPRCRVFALMDGKGGNGGMRYMKRTASGQLIPEDEAEESVPGVFIQDRR